jgi:GNAT superfamily N-acetyltransferase
VTLIRLLGPEDWQVFRTVRLAALKEAPYAFGSKYEDEMSASETSWRGRISGWTRFAAEVDGQVAGLVGSGPGELAGTAALTSLWVDPRFRGRGLGTALIEAVVEWARGQDLSQVLLWVAEGNKHAEALYQRNGFVRTGVVIDQPLREFEMSKRI